MTGEFSARSTAERARHYASEAQRCPPGRKRWALQEIAKFSFQLSAVLFLIEFLEPGP